jgi:hypothetical protein
VSAKARLRHYQDPVLEELGPRPEPDLEPGRYMLLLAAIDRSMSRNVNGRSDFGQVLASTYAAVWAALGYTIWVLAVVAWRVSVFLVCLPFRLRRRAPSCKARAKKRGGTQKFASLLRYRGW